MYPIRISLEMIALLALALAVYDAYRQRRTIRRLIDDRIAQGDADRRAVRNG